MFRAGLLLIIRGINWLAVERILPTASQHKAGSCQQSVNTTHDHTNCCLYTIDPPDEQQQTCSKHEEVNY